MDNIFAVLIHDHTEPFNKLERTLKAMSVETWNLDSDHAGQDFVAQYTPPLVFIELPAWARFRRQLGEMAKGPHVTARFVVVGTTPDISTYASVLEQGATNYIAPPFARDTLDIILQSAAIERSEHLLAMPAVRTS